MNSQITITDPNENKPLKKISTYLNQEAVMVEFKKILGERVAQRFVVSVLTRVAADPKLQSCTPMSIYLAAVRSATLGFSVDPAYHQAYLVAIGNQCQLWPGYKGLVDKAAEAGLGCHVTGIFEDEQIEENPITGQIRIAGKNGFYRPVANFQDETEKNRKVSGYLASFWPVSNPNASKSLFMSIEQIEEYAKTYAPAYNLKDSPWNKTKLSRVEMFKKTVLKILLNKWAPLNPFVSKMLSVLSEAQTEELNENFDGMTIKGMEEREKKSQSQLMAELGFESDNPDPISDELWMQWEFLADRADQVGVPHGIPNREKMPAQDLKEYMAEIRPLIEGAERQAQKENESQE